MAMTFTETTRQLDECEKRIAAALKKLANGVAVDPFLLDSLTFEARMLTAAANVLVDKESRPRNWAAEEAPTAEYPCLTQDDIVTEEIPRQN